MFLEIISKLLSQKQEVNKIEEKMTKSKYIWILDAGHGGMINGIYQTAPNFDKNDPSTWKKCFYHKDQDVTLFEGEFNRDVVAKLAKMLADEGIEHHVLVPEQEDIRLKERVRRANNLHVDNDRRTVYVSVHGNAGGGTGYEVFTSVGTTRSDAIATEFFNATEAEFTEFRMRKDVGDGDPDKEAQFYVLKHTMMPAVLTENFFFDKYDPDCKLMASDDGRERIAKAHFEAIKAVEADDNL